MRYLFLLTVCACNGAFGRADASLTLPSFLNKKTAAGVPEKDPTTGRYICDDKRYPAVTEARPLARAQYQNAVRDIFDGNISPSSQFPASNIKPASGFSTEANSNVLGDQGVEQAVYAAEDVAEAVAGQLGTLLPCAATQANRACAGTFVDKYARRAYRRALSTGERDELLATFDMAQSDGANFAESIAFIVDHMLQTAHFLWVTEAAATTGRDLTGDELASRLSFLLWDSIPDDELLNAASNLTNPDTLVAQAQRLLASPKADTALARFFREWSGTEQVTAAMKDPDIFTSFDSNYAASMNESFNRFVVAQVREDGSLQSLLRSTDAYVDARMAGHFGVGAPASGWAKVSLDATRYSGLMTQPALLASLAHPNETSYVFRGRFVRKRMLCDVLGAPPGNAMSEFAALPLPPNPTAKETSASVNAKPACTGCHGLMDPAGLALEHFDGIGRWRDSYASGKSIDTSGALPGVRGETLTFNNHVELARQLSEQSKVSECFATNLFRFTFSRLDEPADGCSVQSIGDALAQNGGNLKAAILAVTHTDAFVLRRDQ